ncbi:MAG: hypothetical protein HKN14_06110 [Marinicaulis sp.]|nr:hypothetical protein [Marinicaulis sp.]NNE40476.1 hypothetical protein [Marinicaulis sp.]NNL89568.1 hypothetical protein [Marinicaulis sp.]
MARIVVAFICLIALGFGLIRVGAGTVLMAQAAGIIDVVAFNEPITDINRFMGEKNDQAIVPLNAVSYLGVIAFMGVSLVLGAVGSWRRKIWGYGVLALYLATHAALFVNFQTINPKINILIAGIVMYFTLIIANSFRRSS